MRASFTAVFAGLLSLIGWTGAWAVDATHEPTEVVTTTVVTTTQPVESTTTQAPLPLVDLSGVDWVSVNRQRYGDCGEWRDLARSVGWPDEEWDTLSFVLHRESRCNIMSYNGTDPSGGSRGLMQINGYWCRPNQWTANGWLQDRGILTTCDDLYNPEINLRAGLAIWLYGEEKHGCGWKGPWATRCS